MFEQDLYQELVLDHGRRPKNFGRLDSPSFTKFGKNPACGDHLVIYLCLHEKTIKKISSQGSGCVMSMASASLMTEFLKGKSLNEAQSIIEYFSNSIEGKISTRIKDFYKLEVLSGVKNFPSRIKCVTLAWNTVFELINQSQKNL